MTPGRHPESREECLIPGSVLAGRYRIIDEIGRGGMGLVYKALDLEVREVVALKLIDARLASDPRFVSRFKDEMKLARRITHRRVCRTYDVGSGDGVHFISMQYVPGEALSSLLHRVGRLSHDKIRQIVLEVCEALGEAHRSGIVHGDLKPGNIAIDRDGSVVLMDFGLSRSLEIGQERPGEISGTPHYMAPETVRGEPSSVRSDIYSLGCVLYELLEGRPPYSQDSAADLLRRRTDARRAVPRFTHPGADTLLEWIATKCLATDPADRFESTEAIGRALAVSKAREEAEFGIAPGDPRLTRMSRFSVGTGVLAALGVLGLIVALWAGPKRACARDFQVEYPRESALTRAREVVSALGATTVGLIPKTGFSMSDLDVQELARAAGIEEARKAVRRGDAAEWSIDFTETGGAFRPGAAGDVHVSIDNLGNLRRFETTPRADAGIQALAPVLAVARAREVAGKWLGIDSRGFEEEATPRGSHPGLFQVVWRHPSGLQGQREVIRVDLQGNQVVYLGRSLEAPSDPTPASSGAPSRAKTAGELRSAVMSLLFLLIAGFSGISMFKRKLWSELRRPLTVAFGLSAGGAVGGLMFFTIASDQGSVWTRVLLPLVISFVLGSMCVCLVVVCAGALLERLRARTPERLIALEHALRGRFFTRPVAAALTYGTLGGLLVAGAPSLIGWVVPPIDGVPPWVGVSDLTGYVSGRPALLFFLLSSLGLGSLVLAWATGIDLVERLVRRGALVTAVCALFGAALYFDIPFSAATPRATFLVSAVNFLESFLKTAILVHLYRRYGLAAIWLGYAVPQFLPDAVAWTWIGLPSLAMQFYLGLALLSAFLTLGLWGLVGKAAARRLRAFDVS